MVLYFVVTSNSQNNNCKRKALSLSLSLSVISLCFDLLCSSSVLSPQSSLPLTQVRPTTTTTQKTRLLLVWYGDWREVLEIDAHPPSPVMTTMSLSSVAGAFNSTTLRGKHCNISRPYTRASILKADCVTASPGIWSGSRKSVKYNRRGLLLLASDNNRVAADTKSKDSDENKLANDQLLAAKTPSLNSLPGNIQLKSTAKDELGTKTPKESNGSMAPSDVAKKTISSPKTQTRASLTAREKLRAARVLSRFPDSKPSKTELGSKVLDALRESDGRGRKKTGLPEAPTNMLDDSRRGMPKQGLTFDFPGGVDLLIIVTSTIVISTLMFGTTYVVWKAGAIHFNDL